MVGEYILLLSALNAVATRAVVPRCASERGRQAERVQGDVIKGKRFSTLTRSGWILTLDPDTEGWLLEITMKGREKEDLSRLTPPWHVGPNAREIEGWHFRNEDNTGPNEGSVNAPQDLREFIFSPQVGRGIEYHGSGTTSEDVAQVRSFGRGWLHLDEFRLTPARRGERASFEWLKFSACLTWPAGLDLFPRHRELLQHLVNGHAVFKVLEDNRHIPNSQSNGVPAALRAEDPAAVASAVNQNRFLESWRRGFKSFWSRRLLRRCHVL